MTNPRISEFTLEPPATTLQVPRNAQILSVQIRLDSIRLWVLVDPESPEIPVNFYIFRTATPLPYLHLTFIDTVQWGALVLHVFSDVNLSFWLKGVQL